MVRKSDHARRDAERMNGAMSTATLAACLLGILASTILTTRLVRPLFDPEPGGAPHRRRRSRRCARKIDGGDEIAELARDFNAMADHLAEYRSSSLGELLAGAARGAGDHRQPDRSGRRADARRARCSTPTAPRGELLGISDEGPADAVDRARRRRCATAAQRLIEHVRAGRGGYVPKGLEEALADRRRARDSASSCRAPTRCSASRTRSPA